MSFWFFVGQTNPWADWTGSVTSAPYQVTSGSTWLRSPKIAKIDDDKLIVGWNDSSDNTAKFEILTISGTSITPSPTFSISNVTAPDLNIVPIDTTSVLVAVDEASDQSRLHILDVSGTNISDISGNAGGYSFAAQNHHVNMYNTTDGIVYRPDHSGSVDPRYRHFQISNGTDIAFTSSFDAIGSNAPSGVINSTVLNGEIFMVGQNAFVTNDYPIFRIFTDNSNGTSSTSAGSFVNTDGGFSYIDKVTNTKILHHYSTSSGAIINLSDNSGNNLSSINEDNIYGSSFTQDNVLSPDASTGLTFFHDSSDDTELLMRVYDVSSNNLNLLNTFVVESGLAGTGNPIGHLDITMAAPNKFAYVRQHSTNEDSYVVIVTLD